MANEYDLCWQKDLPDWYEIEAFIHEHDPYGHLLSNHSCVAMYDAGRPYQTHISWQTKQIGRILEMMDKYGKPVVIDECCYEGDLAEDWGSITGIEMTARFWRAYCRGGQQSSGFKKSRQLWLNGTSMSRPPRMIRSGGAGLSWLIPFLQTMSLPLCHL